MSRYETGLEDLNVTLTWTTNPEGQVVELAVRCPEHHPTGVTSTMLRRIPVGQLDGRRQVINGRAAELDNKVAEIWGVTVDGGVALDRRLIRYDPARFYRQVALLYRWHVAHGRSPGPALAAANDVAIQTAQQWARKARQRGYLDHGRPGRTG